jgi:membrane dipeptidase
VARLLRETPLTDGHNDLPWQLRKRARNQLSALNIGESTAPLKMHTDLARLKEGGVGAQFWSVYVPAGLGPSEALQATLEQIDVVKRLARRFPEHLTLATTAAEARAAHRAGRVASLIGMEGGHSTAHSLGALRQLYALGARYMTLTHTKTHLWADAATDAPRHGGLSPFGEEVVREMNRLGMVVDLSHVSPDAMRDALRVSRAPVLFTHSGARAVCDHPRNVPDDVLDALKRNGGVVMVVFLPGYLRCGAGGAPGEGGATLDDVVRHIDHIKARVGVAHVGLGGDYDGMDEAPHGLEDVSKYPALLAALLARGYTEEEVRAVMGENALRVLEGAEAAARALAGEEPADAPPLHWVEPAP